MAIICFFFFFFNDTATTEIYTLSLHDALPISAWQDEKLLDLLRRLFSFSGAVCTIGLTLRSEEHTSELQSQSNLVCRLLLEKKKQTARSPLTQHMPVLRHPITLRAVRAIICLI